MNRRNSWQSCCLLGGDQERASGEGERIGGTGGEGVR